MPLETDLPRRSRFQRLIHVSSCESTQALSAADPSTDSAVFWADHQTAGRGRQGRVWVDSPAQDVAATFRITGADLPRPTHLAVAIPVALVRALGTRVGELRIKWPNDILLGGRKLCGILVDTHGRPPHTYHVGVGINVNRSSFPAELMEQSTSLGLATGREFDRSAVLLDVAEAISTVLDLLLAGDPQDALAAEFRRHLGLVGRRVQATTGETTAEGILDQIDLDRAIVAGASIPLAHLQALRLA